MATIQSINVKVLDNLEENEKKYTNPFLAFDALGAVDVAVDINGQCKKSLVFYTGKDQGNKGQGYKSFYHFQYNAKANVATAICEIMWSTNKLAVFQNGNWKILPHTFRYWPSLQILDNGDIVGSSDHNLLVIRDGDISFSEDFFTGTSVVIITPDKTPIAVAGSPHNPQRFARFVDGKWDICKNVYKRINSYCVIKTSSGNIGMCIAQNYNKEYDVCHIINGILVPVYHSSGDVSDFLTVGDKAFLHVFFKKGNEEKFVSYVNGVWEETQNNQFFPPTFRNMGRRIVSLKGGKRIGIVEGKYVDAKQQYHLAEYLDDGTIVTFPEIFYDIDLHNNHFKYARPLTNGDAFHVVRDENNKYFIIQFNNESSSFLKYTMAYDHIKELFPLPNGCAFAKVCVGNTYNTRFYNGESWTPINYNAIIITANKKNVLFYNTRNIAYLCGSEIKTLYTLKADIECVKFLKDNEFYVKTNGDAVFLLSLNENPNIEGLDDIPEYPSGLNIWMNGRKDCLDEFFSKLEDERSKNFDIRPSACLVDDAIRKEMFARMKSLLHVD